MLHILDEHNDKGHLLWVENYVGVSARGATREAALAKLPAELRSFAAWAGIPLDTEDFAVEITLNKPCDLHVEDADSDILFPAEAAPLSLDEYNTLKALTLKSAADFLALYESIPDKTGTTLTPRKTFYGDVPLTAEAMYTHTKNVNAYYFGEIGVTVGNEPDIAACCAAGFALPEAQASCLENRVFNGSRGKRWSLRKVLRRFLWHDRIHARAMYRMACRLCGAGNVADPFGFDG